MTDRNRELKEIKDARESNPIGFKVPGWFLGFVSPDFMYRQARSYAINTKHRHPTKSGARYRVVTQTLAVINFVVLMMTMVRYLFLTQTDEHVWYQACRMIGTGAFYVYIFTTLLMCWSYFRARSLYEFMDDDLIEFHEFLTAYWVRVSGIILMFTLSIWLAVWV